MKLLKRFVAAAAAGVMALAVFTGCAGRNSSAFTLTGAVSMSKGGQTAVSEAPVTIVSDGTSTYLSYTVDGNTYEGLTSGNDYYERTYATGTSGAKWTKSALPAAAVSADSSVKTGTITIDGKEYQTQTYDEATYYCTEDNQLKYVYMKTGDEETTIRIDSLSTKIDSSLLAAPAASEIEVAA